MTQITPYKGEKPFIFISYAHRDAEVVTRILSRMYNDQYRVWFDQGIDPGTEWDENIAAHIEQCGYFIAFVSRNYLSSDNCKDELNFARDLSKKRLIVYLEDVELPSGMAMRMNRLQSIFYHRYKVEDDFYKTLYSADGISDFLDAPQKSAQGDNVDFNAIFADFFSNGATRTVQTTAGSGTAAPQKPAAKPVSKPQPAATAAPAQSAEAAKRRKLKLALICLFLGVFGIHRFVAKRYITGILYMFTFGLYGVGILVDMVLILMDKFPDAPEPLFFKRKKKV